ncbi:hypothetical protein [Daejeonella sp. H1SJ63]|jgi:hypothetical protein|uniref:hypothetical protein n=1 Tax=Daejeonella sp. H1SJ63 TaxID=3034145 RepID=UPI0023EE053F|nr:hypothetical protein [Daejeonella sp. H1SJ63]
MIETSTHKTSSLKEIKAESSFRTEDLGEEEQSFYTSIKPELNSIVSEPAKESVRRILEYSRSL